jgi:hypothetical protein
MVSMQGLNGSRLDIWLEVACTTLDKRGKKPSSECSDYEMNASNLLNASTYKYRIAKLLVGMIKLCSHLRNSTRQKLLAASPISISPHILWDFAQAETKKKCSCH